MSPVTLANNNNPQAETREKFSAFLSDEITSKTLSPIAQEYGWSPDRVQSGGIGNAVRSLSIMGSPEILIVDISASGNPLEDIATLADVCDPGTSLIALGNTNDVKLYRELLGAGVQDYILKPTDAATLRGVIDNAIKHLEGKGEDQGKKQKQSKLSIILGVRGGIGASTITTSIAWTMAHKFNRSVALLDLDFQFGTSALTFDLEPGRGLVDALENPGRIDSLFIERAMIKESNNLSILGAEAPLGSPITLDPSALGHLTTELQKEYEHIVVDMPRDLLPSHPYLLKEASEIIVVTDLSLAATRDAIRLLAFLDKTAPEVKVLLVANKVSSGLGNEVNQNDFEASVERKFDWIFPEDRKAILKSSREGTSFPKGAASSKFIQKINALSQTLSGVKAQTKSKSIFGNLFKGSNG